MKPVVSSKRANAEFTGAKTVMREELEVEFKALTKPYVLFARGPVIIDAKVESSGYPAIAYCPQNRNAGGRKTSRSEMDALGELCADAKASNPVRIAVNSFMIFRNFGVENGPV
jgi:hypothetical protein